MSLYGALFSGVSGLAAQSSAMGAISDNITNVNTIGYKGSKVNFSTLVTKQVSLTNYSPGGVQSKPRTSVDVQGLLQATNSSTDVALSGQGFFVVNEAADPENGDMFAYTRAGSFKVDSEGYLQNVSGWYMQGWPLQSWDNSAQASTVQVGNNIFQKSYKDDDGNTVYINDNIVSADHLRPINLNEVGGTASQSRNLRMGANLPNGADIGKIYKQPVTIYDSLGGDATLQFSWSKTAQNTWDVEAYPPEGAKSLHLKNSTGAVYAAQGRLDFQALPTSTAGKDFTMTIGGNTWTFDTAGAGGNNNVVVDPSAAGSLGAYVDNLATAVNRSFLTEYSGDQAVAPTTPSTGGSITVTGLAASTAINTTGLTSAQIVAAINLQTATTGVTAYLNGADVAYYTDQAIDVTVVGTAATDAATYNATFTGTGLTYAERLAGTNSLIFRQYDSNAANDITVSNLNSMTSATSAKIIAQAYDPDGGDSFVVNNLDLAHSTTDALEFNGDGTPKTINVSSIAIDWANGSTDMTGSDEIGMFLGNLNIRDGMTQLNGDYQLAYWSQNGAKFGNFAGVTIGSDGIVTALFDNGVTRPVFQIPVATFVNPNGMSSVSGNVFIATDHSGEPTLRTAGGAGAGQMAAASLEASTVDIGEEFTTMIVTQRAYSAAAKIITTADEMLDELIRVKR